MGLVILLVLGVYLLLSIGVVRYAARWARRQERRPWVWGGLAALVMYHLVFWDWIPTVVAHKYYCSMEAGFWVYKSLEQWKAENPGVMEMLVANRGAPSTRDGDDTNFTDTYLLNQRINKVVKEHRISSVLHIFRHEQELVDIKSNQVLARYVDFRAGYPSGVAGLAPRSAGLTAAKFWLANDRCGDSGAHPQHQFYEFENQVTGRQE